MDAIKPNKMRKESLRYKFSDYETTALARELGQKLLDKSVLEEEKKRVAKQYGSRIDNLIGEIDALNEKITSGYMMRNVECGEFFHQPDSCMKEMRRLDTGQLVRFEPMRASELQEELNLEDEDEDEEEDEGKEVKPETDSKDSAETDETDDGWLEEGSDT